MLPPSRCRTVGIDTPPATWGQRGAKFDCEGWVPSQGRYRSSPPTSNAPTFQAAG